MKNDAPVAVDDSAMTVDRGRSLLAMDLLANDTDVRTSTRADDHECGGDVGSRAACSRTTARPWTTRRTAEFIVGDDTFTYTASDGVSGLQRGDGDGDGDG